MRMHACDVTKCAEVSHRLTCQQAQLWEPKHLSVSHCGSADDGGRMRLDVLAANGGLVRLGHEFLIRGTQATFDQHVARSHQYADQHACTVYVVNVVFTDRNFNKNVHLPSPNTKA